MRWFCAGVVWAVAMAAGHGASAGPLAGSTQGLDVCIVASAKLTLNGRERDVVLVETNVIWNQYDVHVRWTDAPDENCDRLILVKADTEALVGEAAHEAALGWVPFVEGRARRLVFLRLARTRRLIADLNKVSRPEAVDSLPFAKFIGRGLAHELGHVLLNSRTHPEAGLMRGRYRPGDVLDSPARSYTLSSAERAVLLAATGGEMRLTAR